MRRSDGMMEENLHYLIRGGFRGVRSTLEIVYPNPGQSFCFQTSRDRRLHFNWHHHPEAELLVCRSGGGQAHVGDRVDHFEGPAAFLIGANLPHGIAGDGAFDGWIAQVPERCLDRGEGRPEFQGLAELFRKAEKGLRFSDEAAASMAAILERSAGASGLPLWLVLLEALDAGARDAGSRSCSAFSPGGDGVDDALGAVISRVFDEAAARHRLQDAARDAGMSVPTFCRAFKRRTGMTFVEYIHSIRINSAKKMLLQTSLYVDDICYECGFNSLSFFDRVFKERTGKTPREYRAAYAERSG